MSASLCVLARVHASLYVLAHAHVSLCVVAHAHVSLCVLAHVSPVCSRTRTPLSGARARARLLVAMHLHFSLVDSEEWIGHIEDIC